MFLFLLLFFQGAIGQAGQPGVSRAQVTQELGVAANLPARWKREAEQDGRRAFAGTGRPRNEELARLKRELTQVKCGALWPGVVAGSYRITFDLLSNLG